MTPTWLLVIQGADPSPVIAAAGVVTEDPDAHLIVFTETGWIPKLAVRAGKGLAPQQMVFTEPGGGRHAVLLVHWSVDERDRLLAALEPEAEWVFVNRVEDVTSDR